MKYVTISLLKLRCLVKCLKCTWNTLVFYMSKSTAQWTYMYSYLWRPNIIFFICILFLQLNLCVYWLNYWLSLIKLFIQHGKTTVWLALTPVRLGRPGVDCHCRHDGDVAVIQILFLINEVSCFPLNNSWVWEWYWFRKLFEASLIDRM